MISCSLLIAFQPYGLTLRASLASIGISLPTDFGQEGAVCAHTYHDTGKANKLMRETMGRPTNNLISREETSENHFGVLYAA